MYEEGAEYVGGTGYGEKWAEGSMYEKEYVGSMEMGKSG